MSQSFKRGLMILDLFSVDRPVLTLEEIAAELQIAPITAYRYIKVLSESGMLLFDEGKVQLSAKILRFINLFWKQDHLTTIAKEPITALAHDLNETIALCKLEGNDVICIYAVESQLPLSTKYTIGNRIGIYAGSFARVIAANLPNRKLSVIMRQTNWVPHTDKTIIDRQEFLERLKQIQRIGYDISQEEVDTGVTALAVPIKVSGQIIGSLGLGMPSVRFESEHIPSIIGRMQEVSTQISREAENLGIIIK
ncbi:IclR family transcriptional regulator [Neobacillus sp. 114]|uniref:IclR family transcriptional regulator n=1 Tax=Neobacillus sp. 114 TaxID=3048535 RepID=UPI0024C27230|nr:IclR family transcriptional regulator [Neobacillus sp. 114]